MRVCLFGCSVWLVLFDCVFVRFNRFNRLLVLCGSCVCCLLCVVVFVLRVALCLSCSLCVVGLGLFAFVTLSHNPLCLTKFRNVSQWN